MFPSRKWHAVSIAIIITVQALLPMRLSAMVDGQIFEVNEPLGHILTLVCGFSCLVSWSWQPRSQGLSSSLTLKLSLRSHLG